MVSIARKTACGTCKTAVRFCTGPLETVDSRCAASHRPLALLRRWAFSCSIWNMTHDELLAKIDQQKDNAFEGFVFSDAFDALRAVVELHTPDNSIPPYSLKYCTCEEMYPCHTIEAIEKELK